MLKVKINNTFFCLSQMRYCYDLRWEYPDTNNAYRLLERDNQLNSTSYCVTVQDPRLQTFPIFLINKIYTSYTRSCLLFEWCIIKVVYIAFFVTQKTRLHLYQFCFTLIKNSVVLTLEPQFRNCSVENTSIRRMRNGLKVTSNTFVTVGITFQ